MDCETILKKEKVTYYTTAPDIASCQAGMSGFEADGKEFPSFGVGNAFVGEIEPDWAGDLNI
jgi:hypothetical protein